MSEPRDQTFSSGPPPPAVPRPLPAAGWFADPSRRHEHRYWDGNAWTEHVADRGVLAIDPVTVSATASVSEPRTTTAAVPGVAPPPSVPATASASSASWAPEAPRLGPATARVRSLGGLARALTVLLWVAAGIAVLGIFAFANRVAVVNDMLDARTFADLVDLSQRADDADTFVGVVALLVIVVSLSIFVLLIIWMWRAAKNAELLGRTGSRLGPGWAIGGWFVPFANLVIPLLVMRNLWRGSDPDSPPGDPRWRSRSVSPLVGWWWALYLASLLQFGVDGGDDGAISTRSELEDLRRQDLIAIVGMTATIAAAMLLILVVRRLTARQSALLGTTPPPA